VGIALRVREFRKRLSDVRSADGNVGAGDRVFELYGFDGLCSVQVHPAAVTDQVRNLHRVRREMCAILEGKAFETDSRERCSRDQKLKSGANRPSFVVFVAVSGRPHLIDGRTRSSGSSTPLQQSQLPRPVSKFARRLTESRWGLFRD
jgi:hypothetical protein